MKEDPKYWFECVNKRETPVDVCLPDGTLLIRVEAGSKARLCAWDPTIPYARFSRIVYGKGGTVSTDENSEWKAAEVYPGRHLTELVNLTACDQSLYVDGKLVSAMPGIAVFMPVTLNDPLIKVARLTWKSVTKKFRRQDDDRYVYTETKVEQVREPRGRRELRAIAKEVEMAAKAQVDADMKRKFPELAKADEEAS